MGNDYKRMENGEYVHRAVYFKNNPREKRLKGWHVHHCDCNKSNNDISNLVHIPEIVHSWIHKAYGYGKNGKMPSKRVIESAMSPYRENWSDCNIGEVRERIDKIRNNYRVAKKLGLLLSPQEKPKEEVIPKRKKRSKNKKPKNKKIKKPKEHAPKKPKVTLLKQDQVEKAAAILNRKRKIPPSKRSPIPVVKVPHRPIDTKNQERALEVMSAGL